MRPDERILDPEEDRELDGQDRVEVLEDQERDEDLAEADFEEEEPLAAATHYEEVVGVCASILRGDELDVALIGGDLSVHERAALAVLQDAQRGVDHRDERMLYAEDRLHRLNEALVVLQPVLAVGLTPEMADLRGEYDELVGRLADLRDELERLAEAQEEEEERQAEQAEEEGADGEGDGDGENADDKKAAKPAAKPSARRDPFVKRPKGQREPGGVPDAGWVPDPDEGDAPRVSTVWPAGPGDRDE